MTVDGKLQLTEDCKTDDDGACRSEEDGFCRSDCGRCGSDDGVAVSGRSDEVESQTYLLVGRTVRRTTAAHVECSEEVSADRKTDDGGWWFCFSGKVYDLVFVYTAGSGGL